VILTKRASSHAGKAHFVKITGMLAHTGGVSEEVDPPPQWQLPAPPYAAPPGWQQHYPPYGYSAPPGYPQPGDTNGFCIASLVCSLAGILIWFLGPVLGVIFGWIGIRQIGRDGANGRGLAVAGIVIGSVMILLNVLFVVAVATNGNDSFSSGVTV
jgi:hypothetical protein